MMRIALDIDGTITAAPSFFAWLSLQDVEIHVVTSREASERERTERYLKHTGIKYVVLVFTREKGEYCRRKRIEVLFDDLDEFLVEVPGMTLALKVRNSDNFDFKTRAWRGES